MKKVIVLILCCYFWQCAAMVVHDPVNYTQNAITASNTTSQLIKMAEQIKYQIKALEYEIKNTQNLKQYHWRDIASLIQQSHNLTLKGQSISYAMSNLDAEFKERYPNFNKTNPTDYQEAYENWSQTTLNTLQNSLNSIGAVTNDLASEEQLVRNFKQQSEDANGQLQALQVANLINTESIQQLQSLKQIVGAQSNAQTAYMAQQISQASYEEEALSQIVMKMPDKVPAYKENKALGLINSN